MASRLIATRHRPTLTAVLCAAICGGAGLAQQPPPDPAPRPAWPELSIRDQGIAEQRGLRQLGAEDPEAAAAAEQLLVDFGPGVAPLCLRWLGRSQLEHEAALNRILATVVTPAHDELVVARMDDRAVAVRRFAVRWIAARNLAETHPQLEAAAADDDPQVSFSASLGLLALGDARQIERVFAPLTTDWARHGAEVRATLSPARGPKVAGPVVDHILNADELTVIAGLRMLRYAAHEGLAPRIALYLDSHQHAVKKAAINTLRVVVDGDEPLEKMSVFQAIDAAKQWRGRIR